ncbi:MAG TPA: ABC transporter permease [Chloroflexia bacterium]|nr:ABC transporter permease [Chloroflexia bacterium]
MDYADTDTTATQPAPGSYNRMTGVPVLPRAVSPEQDAVLLAPGEGDRAQAIRATLLRALMGVVALAGLVVVWWGLVVVGRYPPYILPAPLDVAERTWSMLLDGSLLLHFGTTTLEAGLGFVLALLVGLPLGYLIARSRRLERVISPYIAVSQGLPVVAIAPLLVLWLQDDLARKVVIVALIVFFPLLVNAVVGLRGIDRSMLEVARISGANPWQTIWYVELPLSLRALLGGVKLGLTLSITGAVVGEFVSSGAGLGFLLILGRGLFDTTLIFVGLVSLALLTVVIYLGVSLLEKSLISWE